MTGAEAGAILGAAGAAGFLLLRPPRLRLAGLVAWAAGCIVLAGSVASDAIADARVTATDRPLLAVAAGVAGAALLVAAAAVVHRLPWAFALAAVAAAPVRVPVSVGEDSAILLVALYAVIAAGAAASAWELLRGEARPPALGPIGPAVAAFVGWSALSLLWSVDAREGAISMLFFFLPFVVMLGRLAELVPCERGLRAALAIQLALALVFAGVAFWQEAVRDVFWNPRIIVANQYNAFFRVNSLFWDASVYGRFMVVTIVLSAGVLVLRRFSPALVAAAAVVFAGLYFAYSQSSMLALAAGAVVLGATFWPRRVTLALVGAAGVAAVVLLAVALQANSAERVTSGRTTLIGYGGEIIERHPWSGAGLGGFRRAAAAGTEKPWKLEGKASHTTPVTVGAELGPVGIAAFAALVAAVALVGLRAGPRRDVRLTVLAGLAAIGTSSLFYNALFEDPATWILVAFLAIAALTPEREPAKA